MLQESPDEDIDRERLVPRRMRARACVAEGDAAVLEAFERVGAAGDPVDVAREIAGGVIAGADLLHVHGPAPRPHRGIDLPIQVGARQASRIFPRKISDNMYPGTRTRG